MALARRTSNFRKHGRKQKHRWISAPVATCRRACIRANRVRDRGASSYGRAFPPVHGVCVLTTSACRLTA